MSPEDLQQYKRLLLQLRSGLRGDIDRTAEAIVAESHPAGEHDLTPSEGVDAEVSLQRSARANLNQVSEALDRIAAGTFGSCETCGGEIGAERLEAIPYATSCIACERAKEEY